MLSNTRHQIKTKNYQRSNSNQSTKFGINFYIFILGKLHKNKMRSLEIITSKGRIFDFEYPDAYKM